MKNVKGLFNFYIKSSFHVALAVCALAGVTVLMHHPDFGFTGFLFLFSATVTGYNFVKYAGFARFHHRSLTRQLKAIQVFSFFCFLLLLYTFFQQGLPFLWPVCLLGLLTLLYALPLFPQHKNLRSFKIVKIVIIALTWTIAALWLPLLKQWRADLHFVVESFSYFALVLALIIPFEIRDLEYDDPELGTLPQLVGVGVSKKIGYLLLAGFLSAHIFLYVQQYDILLISSGITVLTGLLIWFSSLQQREYYASFWVESVPIIWFLSLCAVKWLF